MGLTFVWISHPVVLTDRVSLDHRQSARSRLSLAFTLQNFFAKYKSSCLLLCSLLVPSLHAVLTFLRIRHDAGYQELGSPGGADFVRDSKGGIGDFDDFVDVHDFCSGDLPQYVFTDLLLPQNANMPSQ